MINDTERMLVSAMRVSGLEPERLLELVQESQRSSAPSTLANDMQKQLVEYLLKEQAFFRSSRHLYLQPSERAKKVAWFDLAIEEIKRLVDIERDWESAK